MLGMLLLANPFLFYNSYFVPVALAFLALLAICTVVLQNAKDVRFGYFIFVHLAIELYLWLIALTLITDELVKKGYSEEVGLGILILTAGLLLLFPRLFVASTLFKFSSARRIKSAFAGILILVVLALSFGFYSTTIATQKSFWKTFTNSGCGFEVKYPPTLYPSGGTFGGARCGYSNFDRLLGDQANTLKIDRVADLEYPITNIQLEKTATGLRIERLSQNAQSFSARISNDHKSADIYCHFDNDEMLETCNEMIQTFRFTQ